MILFFHIIGAIILVGIISWLAVKNHRLQQQLQKLRLETQLPEPIKKERPVPEEEGAQLFMNKLQSIMEKHMSNNTLTVEDVVSEMNLGRTVFFTRLKSITGLSPVEYIREIRIKRAAQLLEEDQHNITEVTYMVGMNDSRYFAKCFKNTYGVTPTEYKKKAQKIER